MSDELRVKLAEMVGWRFNRQNKGYLAISDQSGAYRGGASSYESEQLALAMRNAGVPELTLDWCHSIEAGLTDMQRDRYAAKLSVICGDDFWERKAHWSDRVVFATATQRATALLAVKSP